MKLLAARLRAQGYAVAENQEPGGTSIGLQIRRILLDRSNNEMSPMTELLLMFASRAQAAAEVILPALERGEIVLSDRFTDSSLAYQGAARGLGFETVIAAHRLALGDLLPDLTICVEVDVETGLKRAHMRNAASDLPHRTDEARLDLQHLNFHRSVSSAYKQIAAAEPKRFQIINGSGSMEEVADRIWQRVVHVLPQLVER
jgi:dTMP kinase